MTRYTKKLTRDKSGITTVEFAFIAPALLLMTFGTIEFSLLMYVTSMMEGATTISSRLGKTGYEASGSSREQTILNSVNNAVGSIIDISNVSFQTLTYENWDDIGQEEPYQDDNDNGSWDTGEDYDDINANGQWDADMGAEGFGDANDVVVYQVSYPWQIMTPVMQSFLGDDGVFTITTRTVVKNEPYDY